MIHSPDHIDHLYRTDRKAELTTLEGLKLRVYPLCLSHASASRRMGLRDWPSRCPGQLPVCVCRRFLGYIDGSCSDGNTAPTCKPINVCLMVCLFCWSNRTSQVEKQPTTNQIHRPLLTRYGQRRVPNGTFMSVGKESGAILRRTHIEPMNRT